MDIVFMNPLKVPQDTQGSIVYVYFENHCFRQQKTLKKKKILPLYSHLKSLKTIAWRRKTLSAEEFEMQFKKNNEKVK